MKVQRLRKQMNRVTRFSEISPHWQNLVSLWQSFEGLFSIWPYFEPILAILLFAVGQNFIDGNDQILKNNVDIWSYCRYEQRPV